MKRAFTLIELLVVIAIIAILAAILFPVFSQAKTAAKNAADISNLKQIGEAEKLYSSDFDDNFVRVGNWDSSNPDNFAGWVTWALAMDPYQKSVQMNSSPLAAPAVRGGENAKRVGTRLMTYGYNYTYLSPSRTPNWPTPIETVSETAVANPSATIMFGDRAAREAYGGTVYWYGPNTGWIILGTIETPWCYNDPGYWCTDGWGLGSWYNSYLRNSIPEGAFTGANATRAANGGNMVMTDTSTKKMQKGQMAAGTSWFDGVYDWDIQMVDRSKYIWDATEG